MGDWARWCRWNKKQLIAYEKDGWELRLTNIPVKKTEDPEDTCIQVRLEGEKLGQ